MADSSRKGRSKSKASSRSVTQQNNPGEGPSSNPPISNTQSRDESRRHKALEKVIHKAQRKKVPASHCAPPPSQQVTSGRDLSPDRPVPCGPALPPGSEPLFQTLPESIVTGTLPSGPTPQVPTTTSGPQPLIGTQPPSVQAPLEARQDLAAQPQILQPSLQTIVAQAIQQGIAQGIQQCMLPLAPHLVHPQMASNLTQPPPPPPAHQASYQVAHADDLSDIGEDSYEPAAGASGSEVEEGELVRDEDLSDDEGLSPDQPAFIGLFKPHLFRSLLFKALAVTRLGGSSAGTPQTSASGSTAVPIDLFAEPAVQQDSIPAPKLFTDVIVRQWSLPGAGPAPNTLDKRLYPSAPALATLLQVPSVDAPVAALASSSRVAVPSEDLLRPEDKRAEKTLIKAHQSAAWAVRTSTSASFFNRAALLWIKQLQDRLPASDSRTHQDLNKIAAALEYSADATLNSARFAAKTIGSTITSRRLLWLRHWQADARSKWQLASSAYSPDALFGPPLEPLLIETRDRRKILPSVSRRSEARYSPYPRPQSFRSSDARFQRPFRPRSQPQDSQVRQPSRFVPKRSFRGGRGSSFRRSNEETAQAVAIDSLGQPKSPLEKIMVRLCEYHQKHFVRVLNDICTEVQTGYEGQQLSGPENMDVSTCSSGCSQYHIENQEHGTSCSETKLPLLLDAEQSEARGSLRILCHALKHAVELKSTDRRENCSSIRRDFPELPTIRTTSISPRDSPTQGYLTASNTHHSIKNLEGQTSATEQETGTRKGEDDKDQVQSRGLLGGYVAVKATNVNNEENLENRMSSLKNPFKAFPEETREMAFTTSSPRRADKENALQCSSKAFMHQDTEINDQETRSKVENHYLASGKSKGVCHMHPGDKTHMENAKDIWLPINSMPVVQHKTTNGHSRVKSISASTKSTRKSKKSSGLRINDYDNQYDVVYISQPITECHYESKKTVSARKTARKSTRGYYYNGECCELPTIRTLSKTPHSQENGNILATRSEVLTSPIQGISLPSGSYLAAAEPVDSNDDQRSSTAAPIQEDSFNEIRTEQCSYESISSEVSVLKQREASLAEQATMPVSLFPRPVFHSDKDSLFVSSLQTMTVSFPREDEGDLQDSTDILEAHSSGSDSYNCNRSKENSVSIADSVVHPVSEAANNKSASLFLGNVTIPEPPVLIEPESHVSMDLLMPEVSANSMDMLPPLDEPASIIDVSPSIEPPLLSPIDLAEPSVVPPTLDVLDPCMTFPSEIPCISSSVSPVQLVASPRSISPVSHSTGGVPELPIHIDPEPSETLSEESSVVATINMNVELPQLLPNLETAKLPLSLDCTNTHETTIENSQNLKDGLSVECKNVLPLVAGNEDKGEKNVNDTINISETTKSDEEMEVNSETPLEPKTSEKDKKETSSKTNIDKKRKREKKPHIVSDRCLRSQQSLAPTEDSSEQPCSSNSLQFPQLQIKLSKSPGAKRFKREVHLDGATSVCLANDRHHQTLLNDSSKPTEQQTDDENDITIRQTYKKLMAKESVIEGSQNGEDNKDKPAAMLEICLEANSDKRSVHVPTQMSDKTEKQVDLKPESLENSDGPMNIIEELSNHHEASSFICPGSKHAQPEKAMKCKKPALQFYNLRHTPTTAHVVTATRNTSEKAIVQANSDIMTTSADPVVTDEPNARNENSIDFNSMKVLSDKPRFVEWCAEEDNQELITNFNTQYMKIQKGWIQLEKEAQPAPKVKNKSDKLKEIWKSKKRTRKFKGSTEVQKLSPVQMLFMKGFDISNICKWFMETTETKSLVIVKKLNTRIPGDIPLMKLPLQKGSSSVYPSSLQAERLKKHLKKFAAMTPAKNTIKIQKLWTRLRENGDQTESEQIVSPKQTSPSEVSLAQCIGPKSIQPSPSMPVQTSSRILRKYSNLRGKLHGFHRVVKQERHDCVAKQLLAESSSSNKSMCIKPLMSPKLAQQVKTIQLPTKSTPIEKGGKGRKGKGKLQEDTSAKGSLQQSKKKTPNENIRTLAMRQLSPSSKERISLKKVSKVKQVGAPATRKQAEAGRNNKHTSQNEKSKKLIDSRPGKKKSPTHIGKASTSQKASLLSKQQGLMKALKEKMVRDPPSQSLKKASSEKALTRSVKRIQENKTRSKRKLRAKKESSPSKRRRLDAK